MGPTPHDGAQMAAAGFGGGVLLVAFAFIHRPARGRRHGTLNIAWRGAGCGEKLALYTKRSNAIKTPRERMSRVAKTEKDSGEGGWESKKAS